MTRQCAYCGKEVVPEQYPGHLRLHCPVVGSDPQTELEDHADDQEAMLDA